MELHPAIVHFPIALLSIAAIFAVLSLFIKRDFFKQAAFWNLLIGVIAAAGAVLTGLMEERELVHNDAIHEVLEKHEFNGFFILVLSFVLLTWAWVRKNRFMKLEYFSWVFALVLLSVTVFYQGYLGGKMVFGLGAGVKPMEVHLVGDSTSMHEHADSGHGHSNVDMDSTAVKKNRQEVPHTHAGQAHSHGKRDSFKKQDNKPEKKKKELKDMKY